MELDRVATKLTVSGEVIDKLGSKRKALGTWWIMTPGEASV